MPGQASNDNPAQQHRNLHDLPPGFHGFHPPTSNTTYTPNQFFDVCLPHSSRGCVRLVAYMIRKTLGWCDADGNPQEEQVFVRYNDLVKRAGISRDRIRASIDEAIERRFINCVRQPRPSTARNSAVTGLYELRWHDTDEYIKDPKRYRRFFEGEGNRTDIPNQFFDELVPRESLSVIKVVGSVVRFSIGFQARRGRRRQQVSLSFSTIQRYAHIGDRTTLSQAVQRAVDSNYILRVKEGFFSPIKGLQESTTYTLKWLDPDFYLPTGQKTLPEDFEGSEPSDRSENPTSTGQKSRLDNRSENQTTLKRNKRNETTEMKQQQAVAGHAAADSFDLLYTAPR